MNTEKLTGFALDWAVAKCENLSGVIEHGPVVREYFPSTDWALGGPIIEREKMELHPAGNDWSSDINRCYQQYGPTPLIAAMRCYVASKLGLYVTIPKDLKHA